MKVSQLPNLYAVSQLRRIKQVPDWINKNYFYSITQTSDEVSIVSLQDSIPVDIKSNKDWICFKIDEILTFEKVGVLNSFTEILSKINVSIFVISTYNTDYLFVKDKDYNKFIIALKNKFEMNLINIESNKS